MIRRPAARRVSFVVPVVGVAMFLGGCGQTIDLRDEVDAVPTTSIAEVPVDDELPLDGTLDELLPAIVASWRGLDQRVIDGDAAEPLARIETAWAAAEPLVRADHPSSLFGMQQAVDLARSAVERRRPADASKGFRLAIELSDEILSR